jgi:hypothetical protein
MATGAHMIVAEQRTNPAAMCSRRILPGPGLPSWGRPEIEPIGPPVLSPRGASGNYSR